MKTYFNNLNKYFKNEILDEIVEYANANNVPIIKDDGMDMLCLLIKLRNVKKILEIGTAIAYSSINFALLDNDIKVDTIERDKKMYDEAIKNINRLNLNERINVIFSDALEIDEKTLSNDYDLIFIDAAKSQYTKFFLKYEGNLKKGGIIFSDNLLFHGLIENATGKESRDLKQMLRKIKSYNTFLYENDNYDTTFLRIGDGVAISIKK